MATVLIRHEHCIPKEKRCTCNSAIPHQVYDHALVAHRYIVGRRCSVCGEPWGEGAPSPHEGCTRIMLEGDCIPAYPRYYLDNGDELIFIDGAGRVIYE